MSAVEILDTYHLHHHTRHVNHVHSDGTSSSRPYRHLSSPEDDTIPDYISEADFIAICPAIILQLDEKTCSQQQQQQQQQEHQHNDDDVLVPKPCGTHQHQLENGATNCTRHGHDVNETTSRHDVIRSLLGVPLKSESTDDFSNSYFSYDTMTERSVSFWQ